MKIDLTVDQGPCNTELRSWCLGIAIYSLLTITFSVLFAPNVVNFVGFAIAVAANVLLLIGCLKYKHQLLVGWLIYALICAIGFPFAIFGVIFHYGGYREATGFNNIFGALLSYIVQIVIVAFCARLIYSYYLQLKNRQGTPQAVPVV
ncbi:uncharacterized protein LOC117892616 [Drosophila subobscura]|uniref:uncharacterized protein LOC117892616 n=1 Tax=Drosophila subobscura TaxID=7241 RepID=UPI00155AB1EE|nr:uncharacterized protein LOC117892616 [Drosophila subobscura]